MSTPYQITVMLTDECNMRCSYCTTIKRPVYMAEDTMSKLVVLLQRTQPAALNLEFHGGEPLLAWNQVRQLAVGLANDRQRRKITYNLCTNGTEVDFGRASFLAAHHFIVRVSIDGMIDSHILHRRAAHDRSRREATLYHERSIAGLRSLVQADVRTAVNLVVTPQTVSSLRDNAVFLIEQGLVKLIVSPVVGFPWSEAAMNQFSEQLRALSDYWVQWSTTQSAIDIEELRKSIHSELHRAEYCQGLASNKPDAHRFVIGPDGRVFADEPDERTESHLVIGHVNDIEHFDELPSKDESAFQVMFSLGHYSQKILDDVRTVHRLLYDEVLSLQQRLFS